MKQVTEKTTQQNEVLKHLKKHRSLTSKEAFELFGATRLSDVIFKLRAKGYDIRTTMIESKTRYGTPTAYAKYTYIKYNGVDNRLMTKRLRGEA